MVKNPPANTGDRRDTGSVPGLERSPGGCHGNPLQHSCLENPMDRGAWQATVHGVAKSQTRLRDFHFQPSVWSSSLRSHQAPLSMGFPRQEYRSGLPFPSPGNEHTSLASPALGGRFFTTSTTWEALRVPWEPLKQTHTLGCRLWGSQSWTRLT